MPLWCLLENGTISNTGSIPLKVYVIYAPPEHPYGTVHGTKAIAMSSES